MRLKLIPTIAMLGLMGCEAYDLGSEAADHVVVATLNPTWDNGIGLLVATKCANCHTASRSKFVPQNTPDTYDRMGEEEFFTTAQVLERAIVRVEHTTLPMPPNFGTPLYDDEKSALLAFAHEALSEKK